jgi:hypothetical protein
VLERRRRFSWARGGSVENADGRRDALNSPIDDETHILRVDESREAKPHANV